MNNEGLENRYNRWHSHNTVTFYLDDFIPDQEECRILMLKVLEQVVRDYMLLKDSEFANDRYAWATAASFIYDDSYWFTWGDLELSPEEFLEILDLDIHWFRMHISKRFEQKYGVNNAQEERRSTRDSRNQARSKWTKGLRASPRRYQ